MHRFIKSVSLFNLQMVFSLLWDVQVLFAVPGDARRVVQVKNQVVFTHFPVRLDIQSLILSGTL